MAKPEGTTPARSDTKRSANTDAASGPPNGPNTLASPLDWSTTCTTCGSSKRFASHAAITASTRAATDETGATDLRFNCRRTAPRPRRPSARNSGGGGFFAQPTTSTFLVATALQVSGSPCPFLGAVNLSQYLEALDTRLKLAAVFDHDDRRMTSHRRDGAV